MTPVSDDLFVVVRAFLLSLFPSGVEVVQGLQNGVPMPAGPFICMTAKEQTRLATNHTVQLVTQERAVKMPTQYSIQLDCYGPNSSDQATTIKALWRDFYGCDMLASVGAPLYASEPVQMPLVNGEQQYEQRWMTIALLQFNPVVTVPQQSAIALAVELVSVDVEFPPTP